MVSDPVSKFEGIGDDPSTIKRPIGKKKAKMAQQSVARDDLWKNKLADAHTKLAVQSKTLNTILKDNSDLLKLLAERGAASTQLEIMTKNLDNLDDEQVEFFRLKRSQIISSLRANASSSNTPSSS
ncbi:hypothetical protein PCASD_02676 [Puccinia coronata f. sp. avenae]|uniref:No apical meristem-associated C-terminal domain-containing protein n=1 Tax=Puccinia coronata f. sp. avenae TaxID=200324 RepID=A0A2N5VH01_9BASI|nr:hypothetical protein PCASD_02676 [Puccinia coronata f. sp. avenae]